MSDDGPKPAEDDPGYWERKAAEDAAREQPDPQVRFNPQSGTPVGEQPPPQYPPGQYPPAPYPPAPYATGPQPTYGAPPGWSPHPGAPMYPAYLLPDHPKSTSALVVGLIAVAGAFTCVLPILAAPVAWVLGVQARREIRRAPQQWGGEGKATAGMVLGIIGTVLLVLGVLFLVLVIALAVNDPTMFDDNTSV